LNLALLNFNDFIEVFIIDICCLNTKRACHHESYESGVCLDLRRTPETDSPSPWGSIEQVKNHWSRLMMMAVPM
jgi:hypothetical protein